MSPYRRNVMVGATVLGGLGVLGWMILKFGGAAMIPFTPTRIPIHFITQRADGLSDGAIVSYRGVNVGQVTDVSRMANDQDIRVDAQVDADPPLPGNIKGVIRSQGLVGGGSMMVITLVGDTMQTKLKPDQEIPSTYVGLDILPPEFAELATDLRLTSQQFRESNVITHIDQQVQHLGTLVDSVQKFVDDSKLRQDLQQSVANIRVATEQANQIGQNLDKFTKKLDQLGTDASLTLGQARQVIDKTQGHIDELSASFGQRLTQVAALLDQTQAIAQKINAGQGTAGQLINDPKLYQSLVDSAQELTATITDVKRLIDQWEREGVSLKLSK